jgi:drug/metabolite transporter (DMT)-like permease
MGASAARAELQRRRARRRRLEGDAQRTPEIGKGKRRAMGVSLALSTSATIGVALALCASFCSALANILIKYAHEKRKADPERADRSRIWWVIIPLYVANGERARRPDTPIRASAIRICDALGVAVADAPTGGRRGVFASRSHCGVRGAGLCDFAAFGFAPMSLVAPTGALTIAINAVLAYLFFGERLSGVEIMGTALILVGSITAIAVGSRSDSEATLDDLLHLYTRPAVIIYGIINVGVVVLSFFYISLHEKAMRLKAEEEEERRERGSKVGIDAESSSSTPLVSPTDGPDSLPPDLSPEDKPPVTAATAILRLSWRDRLRALASALLSSGLSSWTNLMGKSAVELVKTTVQGSNQMNSLTAWVFLAAVVGCAVLQLRAMSYMMRSFDAVLVVPIYQCLYVMLMILTGIVYFNEGASLTREKIPIFIGAILVCMCGIICITQRGKKTELDRAIDAGDSASHLSRANTVVSIDRKDEESVSRSYSRSQNAFIEPDPTIPRD